MTVFDQDDTHPGTVTSAVQIAEARKANAAVMRQYAWQSRTEVLDQGQVKDIRLEVVNYAPDGQLQRTLLNDQGAPTIGTILRDNGYSTSWFGKDHNTPSFQASQAGLFDQWPIGLGFEYFYGFVGGDTSQWQPNLFRNNTAIYPYVE